ncbi:hypothetical protein EA74_02360 [Enterococcus hirae]|nr:hypothetical protein EA74_02360 [Enterococcus hirae]RBT66244.1 hypothetical protein EA82_02757 [Enterococcus hirae]
MIHILSLTRQYFSTKVTPSYKKLVGRIVNYSFALISDAYKKRLILVMIFSSFDQKGCLKL